MPPGTRRYTDEFVVKDVTNGKQYLADLVWSWYKGLDLTGWTLGGTTNPTIAADGQIDCYDATNLNDQPSYATYLIPNSTGGGYYIFHCKFTRQVDDTSTDVLSFIIALRPWGGAMNVTNGAGYIYVPPGVNALAFWNNTYDVGTSINVPIPVIGVEQSMDIIVGPKDVIFIMNNILIASIPTGKKGTAPLPNLPIKDFFSYQKNFLLWTRHDAGQVSHYRFHDIKVGRLVGQGAL